MHIPILFLIKAIFNVLVLLQGASARYTPYSIQKRSTSEDFLARIIQVIQIVVAKANIVLENAVQVIGNLANFYIVMFEENFDNYRQLVEKLIQKSNELGTNVTTCVHNEEDNLVKLKKTFESQINDLKNKTIDQVKDFIKNVVTKLYSKFYEYKAQLGECSTSTCYANVFVEAIKYSKSVMEDIIHTTNQILANVEHEKDKIVDKTLKKANKIITDFTDCVNG